MTVKRLSILAALVMFCLVPALGRPAPPKTQPPKPMAPAAQTQPLPQPATPPQSSPQPRRAAALGEDIDWLSEYGLGAGGTESPDVTPQERDRAAERRREAVRRLQREDPERYKRVMKIRQLSREYRGTDDPKRKAAIEKELTPLVDQELRIQHENNKKRIVDMERRLKEAKKVLDQREDNWDKVVDFTVKELTGQNAYLRAVRPGHERHQRR
jgi:hypothetical protein